MRKIRFALVVAVLAVMMFSGFAKAEDERYYQAAMGYGWNGTEWKRNQVDTNGNLKVAGTDSIDSVTDKYITVAYTASQTAATVLTPTSGKKVIILDIVISASAAGTVYLFDNTDGAMAKVTPILSLAANGGYASNTRKTLPTSAADNVVKYTSGSGSAGSIWIHYFEQ